MSQVQIESKDRFVLPSGKEFTPFDVIRFCHGLSGAEIDILMSLLKSSPNRKLAEDLEQELIAQLARLRLGHLAEWWASCRGRGKSRRLKI